MKEEEVERERERKVLFAFEGDSTGGHLKWRILSFDEER